MPHAAFVETLERVAARLFADRDPTPPELARSLGSLHLEDLALACACRLGRDAAWDHFVAEYRPVLYRAADAIDPGGRARELADALYGDLYGTREKDGSRESLFRYFHGRSTLATWLRAVLAQRHVDGIRAGRRFDSLPADEAGTAATMAAESEPDPEHARDAALIERALTIAVAALAPRDRLRLASYYSQQLTLAQTGRLLREHEATVSRQLARTRGKVRRSMEEYLRTQRLTPDEIARVVESVASDSGALDLSRILRKDSAQDRSI